MKKKLSILILVVALVLTFAFVGCSKPHKDVNNTKVGFAKNDLITVSAVSVGNMMGTYGTGTALVAAEITEETPEVAPVDPTLVKINYYMSVVDGILGKNVNSTLTDIAADDPDYGGKYAKKNVITTGTGDTVETYTMIYNEQKLNSTSKEDEEETEVEEEFAIDGLLIVKDVKYLFEGKRETESETEEGKTEAEVEFSFTAYLATENANGDIVKDVNNYINFKQEIEQEEGEVEQEFFYEIFKEGKSIKAFSLEIERDPVDNELEVELVDGNLQLKFESEVKNDKEYIEIYALENGEQFVIEAEVTVNELGDKVYKYSQDGKADVELEDDFDKD